MPQKKLAKKITPKKVKKLPVKQISKEEKQTQISTTKSHKYSIFKIVIWTLTILFLGSAIIIANIVSNQRCDYSFYYRSILNPIIDSIKYIPSYIIGMFVWSVALFCSQKKLFRTTVLFRVVLSLSLLFYFITAVEFILNLPSSIFDSRLTLLINSIRFYDIFYIIIFVFIPIICSIKSGKFLWYILHLIWGITYIALAFFIDAHLDYCYKCSEGGIALKPIIYLYPKEKTDVSVQVAYPEKFTHTYPHYTNGWFVEASPNGDLVDKTTGRNLYALYWEGKETNHNQNPTEGFVVAGQDTISFLETKLAQLGLTEREADEFIIYWLPKLEGEKYNFIRFQTKAEQDTNMPLLIEPKPDTVIRVLMEYDDLDEPITVQEQVLPPTPVRTGFTVVEWGGTELDID